MNVYVSARDSSSAQLTWDQPESDGGLPILDYVVRSSSDPAMSSVSTITTSDESAMVAGLMANAEYYFQVAARNSAGTGPFSSTVALFLGKCVLFFINCVV